MSYTLNIAPKAVGATLKQLILKDGYDMVMDLARSQGAWVYDSMHDRRLLDFFTCFATIPVGYNHPKMVQDEAFKQNLLEAALVNPSNSDIYTQQYARFIETFRRVAVPSYLHHAFFIAGGGLAVENALKVAMDWKVQKNYQKGYTREVGTQVLHFQEAFHGRTGYTLSLTNTDPAKTDRFAKFHNWPRVLNPKIQFPYSDEAHEDLLRRETLSLAQIQQAFVDHRDEICAIIVEPIQGEGGDNHFRREFMEQVKTLCLENDALLIYDEVQMGVGATGKFWAHEHYGPDAQPDLIAFGKKMQVCGILAGPRVDEVETNCFRVSSRINSTWGGNLVDMVRADRILEIIEEDNILANATDMGDRLQAGLLALAQRHPGISNVRGRGLICAFNLPSTPQRNAFVQRGLAHHVLFLGAAQRTIRFRPTLTINAQEIDRGLAVIDAVLTEMDI
jgi:L-lysine 6-transaminase